MEKVTIPHHAEFKYSSLAGLRSLPLPNIGVFQTNERKVSTYMKEASVHITVIVGLNNKWADFMNFSRSLSNLKGKIPCASTDPLPLSLSIQRLVCACIHL